MDKFCYLGDMLSVDGDAGAAVEARVGLHKGWISLDNLCLPIRTSHSLREENYTEVVCVVDCYMTVKCGHAVKKQNELTLQWAEMIMIGTKVTDRFSSSELRREIIIMIQRHRLRWYRGVLRKDENSWVKKCTNFEVEGVIPTVRQQKTWTEVAEKDCQTRQICKEDAMDRRKWIKLIKDVV